MRLQIGKHEYQAVGIEIGTTSAGSATNMYVPYSESARDLLVKMLAHVEAGMAAMRKGLEASVPSQEDSP